MHEATLVTGILRIALDEARKHAATRITAVKLDVGLLACVEEHTLEGCFEIFAEGTMAEGARLDMRSVPLPCSCNQCGNTFMLEKRSFQCPSCEGNDLTFEGGHGCAVSAIEASTTGDTHD